MRLPRRTTLPRQPGSNPLQTAPSGHAGQTAGGFRAGWPATILTPGAVAPAVRAAKPFVTRDSRQTVRPVLKNTVPANRSEGVVPNTRTFPEPRQNAWMARRTAGPLPKGGSADQFRVRGRSLNS